jgi:hypothetical protein
MLPTDFPNYDSTRNLNYISKLVLQRYWQNHDVILVSSHNSFDDVDSLLSYKTSENILLVHFEEDSYFKHNMQELRLKIKNSKYWTKDSFTIVSSRKDYEENHNIINMLYRPAITDLLSYRKYTAEDLIFSTSNIKFHTGMIFNTPRRGREEIAEILSKHSNKCSMISFVGERDTYNLFNIDRRIKWKHGTISAPSVNILDDLPWSDVCAFSIGYENYHHGPFLWYEPVKSYAPTLSEKTYKAMHLLRPSLTFGGPGSKKLLNDLGFDTWDWFIDWSYDYEEDFDKGFSLYLSEIDRLMNTDIVELVALLNKNKDALLHNRARVFELITNYKNDDYFPL